MPTWQIITWALIALLFIYALSQIIQAVRISMRTKAAQRTARKTATRRAASLTTPPPAPAAPKPAAPRKDPRLDFSPFRPPKDEDPVLKDALEDDFLPPPIAPAAPRSAAAPRPSFEDDLQAQIDLLSTYDQLAGEFTPPPHEAERPAPAEAEPYNHDSEADFHAPAPEEPAPAVEETAPAADLPPADPQSDLPLDAPAQPVRPPMPDPTTPREADELVLFSGDGAPPTTLWSRHRPAPTPAAPEPPAPPQDEAPIPEDTAQPAPAPAHPAEPQPEPHAAPETPPDSGEDPYPLELELRQFRRELAHMRSDMAEQRERNARLNEALDAQRARNDELENELRALREQVSALLTGQNISPEYNEALLLARGGMGVEELAARCGITVSEAQLVCSMAAAPRGQTGEPHEPQ